MKYVTHVLLTALVGMTLIACTDSGLQQIPEPDPPYVDNLLDIHGEYCTSPAEEMEFPVKILIVMDQSASLQCTDPSELRNQALNQLIADVSGTPSVFMGYVGFHADIFRVDFTTPEDLAGQLVDINNQLGPATDYQGALSVVLQMIEQDLLNSPISLRARTKYIVEFISDGVPEPRCDAGCEDDTINCSDGVDNDGDGIVDGADDDCDDVLPDDLYGVCNTDEEIPEGSYVDMRSLCPEYNQIPQLMRRVEDLVVLADAYGVGDLTFHTTFLFAPQDVVDARCGGSGATFGYVREEAQPLLQAMAEAGRGLFQEVNTALASEGGFLRVDYQPLESSFDLTETIGVNQNSMPSNDGRIADTDGDGLSDDDEFERSLDRFSRDTDNDGFSDFFERRYEASGFDGLDGNRPQICCPSYGFENTCCTDPGVCTCFSPGHPLYSQYPPPVLDTERVDRDGDGLNTAEEHFIGTDVRDPDTDGDRLPDGLEFRLWLDPTEPDALADHDFDGLRTRDEVRAGSNPQVPDAEYEARSGMRYSIEDLGEDDIADRHCYDFEVNGVELVTTLQQIGVDGEEDPISQGINRTYVMMIEEPVELAGHRGNLFIACAEATYLGQQFKDPPSGLIDLSVISEACYRTCLGCDIFETVDECRARCERGDNPDQCDACDEPCNIFQESEVFDPAIHCVSSMCSDPEVWGNQTIDGTTYFMCNDDCVSDGRCNCNCAYDCDCNSYRSERCSTARVCGG